MDISKMTRKDFEKLPLHNWENQECIFDSLVILPGKAKDVHNSGYRCMSFIAVQEDTPLYRLSGCSDAVHIDGIGGMRRLLSSVYWTIDCLSKSGLLRIWPNVKMSCGPSLSSFEIFAEDTKNKI